MDAILRDVVVVVRTRPRAIPLAMITTENQFMGFLCFLSLLSIWGMGLHLTAFRAAGAPLLADH